MAYFNTYGQTNTTVVSGSSYTGLYATDGSLNIVINNGTTYKGRYNPCGAINAVVTTDIGSTTSAPNGSIYVCLNNSGGYSPTPLGGASAVPPAGYGVVYFTDANGDNQLATFTDANGVQHYVYMRLPS